jgi:hypothetical protein
LVLTTADEIWTFSDHVLFYSKSRRCAPIAITITIACQQTGGF